MDDGGGGVGEGQDFIAKALENLLIVVDDAETVGAEQLLAWHHRVDGISLFDILRDQVVTGLAKADLKRWRVRVRVRCCVSTVGMRPRGQWYVATRGLRDVVPV